MLAFRDFHCDGGFFILDILIDELFIFIFYEYFDEIPRWKL
jgi:hypothetical protein